MKLMTIPIRFLLPIRPELGRTSVRTGLLACLPVFALLAAGPVHAATLTVCPSGCDFTAIQPAVDSALSDDTIRIFSGVFPGLSITDKSLVLRGEGASRTVIDLGPTAEPTLNCSRSFPITIQDLAIINTRPEGRVQSGLRNSGCKLKLKNSTVTGHTGTGITSEGRGSTLSIEDSVVAGNGGGIVLDSGTGTLIRSAVINNGSRFGPGGISNSGELTLIHSVIANNEAFARDGGGISNSGKLKLKNSTVLSNIASFCDESQGCTPSRGGRGGGIFNAGSAASASLIGSFITSNFATLDGGGVFNEGGTVSQTDTLIINNNPNDCVGC
jgi:hypothetical protein